MLTNKILKRFNSKKNKPNLAGNEFNLRYSDFAGICYDAYNDVTEVNKPGLNLNWGFIARATVGGYAASCYYNYDYERDNCTISIAFRGTVFNADNLWADFNIAIGRGKKILTEAYTILNILQGSIAAKVGEIKKKRPNTIFTFINTGHSLGAYLAQMTGDATITFESPGIGGLKSILKEAFLSENNSNYFTETKVNNIIQQINSNSINILNDVNVINTYSRHEGTVYRLINHGSFGFKLDGKDTPNLFLNLNFSDKYYIYSHLSNTHKIINIYLHLLGQDSKIKYELDPHHPSTLQGGYVEYLDVDKRQKYWDAYAHILWKLNKFLKVMYKNDVNKFIKDHLDYVKRIHFLASGKLSIPPKNQFIDSCNSNNLLTYGLFKNNNSVTIDHESEKFEFQLIENDKDDKNEIVYDQNKNKINCLVM